MSLPVNITNIGHTSFNARNMQAMIHFYGDIIGMEPLFTTTYGELAVSFKRRIGDNPTQAQLDHLHSYEARGKEVMIQYLKLADRQYLELFYDDGSGREAFGDRNEYYGYFKKNFEVDDINEIKARLVESGVTIYRNVHKTVDGSLELAVHDPDGNEVQFTQYCENARKKLGMLPLTPRAQDNTSLARYTTQVAYHVRANAEMKQFYCEGLGLKNVATTTYSQLVESLQQNEAAMKNTQLIKKLKRFENLPWLDFIEVAPHQYLELFYDYDDSKKERRELTKFYGYQHLCLEVEDIHQAWDAVIANGIIPDTPINLGGDKSWQFWIVDPDGNRTELMQYSDDSKQLW